MRQFLRIRFDRPIEKDKHYISPGGFEVELGSGEVVNFDFFMFYGCIDKNDPTILNIEQSELDLDSFPEAKALIGHIEDVVSIRECYVYTGEWGDPAIYPVDILYWEIDGVEISKDTLKDFNTRKGPVAT